MCWISAANEASFNLFESAFERLQLARHAAQYLDLKQAPRLYAGFIVQRSRCTAPNFHVDWSLTDNQAFTAIMPLAGDAESFGLLYRQFNGTIAEYDYRCGEAILFGDHFSHSTKPGTSDWPVSLLCFEFGTDRMEHWPKILATLGGQTPLVQQPDGKRVATGV